MHGIELDASKYHAVLVAYGNLGMTAFGYTIILEEMCTKEGCLPAEYPYNILIHGFYKDKYNRVEKVMRLMEKNGCPPTESLYNQIKRLCKMKNMDGCRSCDG